MAYIQKTKIHKYVNVFHTVVLIADNLKNTKGNKSPHPVLQRG